MKKFLVLTMLMALFIAPASVMAGGPSGIFKDTEVQQALANDLNGQGQWNQISFADGTTQTTAASAAPVGDSSTTEILFNNAGTLDGMSFFTTNGTGLDLASGHFVLPLENDAVTPTQAFGDGGDGFYSPSDGVIRIALNAASRWIIDQNIITGGFSGAAALRVNAVSSTLPGFSFDDDLDTGMGSNDDDQVSGIAGGVELLRLTQNDTGTDTATLACDLLPDSDTAWQVGSSTARFADINTVLTNGADFCFQNGWRLIESEDFYGYPSGVALVSPCDWRTAAIVGSSDPGVGARVFPKGSVPVAAITGSFVEIYGLRFSTGLLYWIKALPWFYIVFGLLITGVYFIARRIK